MIQRLIPNPACPSAVAISLPVFVRGLTPLVGSSTHDSPEHGGRGAGSLGRALLLRPFLLCFSPQRPVSVRNALITIVYSSVLRISGPEPGRFWHRSPPM